MVSFILPGNSASGEYEVANSLRFNSGSSDSLEYNQSTPTNAKKFTISVWCKFSGESANAQEIIAGGTDGSNETFLRYTSNETIQFRHDHASDTNWQLQTTAKFRDPSAWLHLVAAVDTTQGTASNRVKLYVNGSQITDLGTENYPAQNEETFLNKASATVKIGQQAYTNSGFFDGYMTEFVFIDGQALDPTSFGKFDSDSPNIWKPKNVSGLTFGTNGFYLNVPGPSTGQNANGLGGDSSGNDNHFGSSGLSAVDRVTDTCTNNFATLNPIYATGDFTFTEGNLQVDDKTTSNDKSTISTIGFNQGKWYLEFKIIDQGGRGYLGFTDGVDRGLAEGNIRSSPAEYGMYMPAFSSSSDTSGTANSNLGTATDNDIICFAFDADNGQLFMSKNGNIDTSSTATITGITTGNNFHFFINETASNADVSGYSINFGNPAYSISSGNSDANGYGNFEYSVPSGYYALNTKNLAEFG